MSDGTAPPLPAAVDVSSGGETACHLPALPDVSLGEEPPPPLPPKRRRWIPALFRLHPLGLVAAGFILGALASSLVAQALTPVPAPLSANTVKPPETTVSEPVNLVPLQTEPLGRGDSPLPVSRPPDFAYLRAYRERLPQEGLLQGREMQARLRSLLGTHYEHFIANLSQPEPVLEVEEGIFVRGVAKGRTGLEEAALFLGYRGQAEAAMLEEEGRTIRYFGPGQQVGDLQPQLAAWCHRFTLAGENVLEQVSWTSTRVGQSIVSQGEVRNITRQDLTDVEAVISYYDTRGRYVDHATAAMEFNPIRPGQVAPFKVIVPFATDMKAARLRFKAHGGELPSCQACVTWQKNTSAPPL